MTHSQLPQPLHDLKHVVAQSSTPKQIFDHILSAVSVGALAPGSALPSERDLAAGLHVSRSSVRIALERLERAGIVQRRRGRGGGTFIAQTLAVEHGPLWERAKLFRASQIAVLETRLLIQGQLAQLAAARITTGQLDTLRAAVEEYAQAADAISARKADAFLHASIAAAAHNPVLASIAHDLDTQINAGFRHDPFSRELFERARHDHANIVDAIAQGDGELARKLCEEHFRITTLVESQP